MKAFFVSHLLHFGLHQPDEDLFSLIYYILVFIIRMKTFSPPHLLHFGPHSTRWRPFLSHLLHFGLSSSGWRPFPSLTYYILVFIIRMKAFSLSHLLHFGLHQPDEDLFSPHLLHFGLHHLDEDLFCLSLTALWASSPRWSPSYSFLPFSASHLSTSSRTIGLLLSLIARWLS